MGISWTVVRLLVRLVGQWRELHSQKKSGLMLIDSNIWKYGPSALKNKQPLLQVPLKIMYKVSCNAELLLPQSEDHSDYSRNQ